MTPGSDIARLVVPAEEAATDLEYSPAEIEELARQHPTRFGLLDGPPALLFAYVPPSAGREEER